ncbi:MAG: TlpA family protein disulfide reductase [Oscillospiraceae bacterium]|nr:TlpA family protein disulfide reductase [Oscillospiraceae bacterium]
MSQKAKLILGVAGFALLLAGAAVAYNALRGQVQPDELTEITQPTEITQAPDGESWSGIDFTVTDAAGNPVKLSDLRGKPVVLNFWASWCPPCRQEMPEFDKAHKELGGEIQFMMVDLTDGARETTAVASQFVREQGYGFPVYFDTQGQAADAYGIRSIPATYFIDARGRVVSSQVGSLSEAALRRGLESLRP